MLVGEGLMDIVEVLQNTHMFISWYSCVHVLIDGASLQRTWNASLRGKLWDTSVR
jgi:hypothetical protein